MNTLPGLVLSLGWAVVAAFAVSSLTSRAPWRLSFTEAWAGGSAGCAVQYALRGRWAWAAAHAAVALLVLAWWWWRRHGRRLVRRAGAKVRAVLAKMAARLRDRARTRPVPVPA